MSEKNVSMEAICYGHKSMSFNFANVAKAFLNLGVVLTENDVKAYECVKRRISRDLPVIPSAIFEKLTPEDISSRIDLRTQKAIPYEILDESTDYAPGVLIAITAYAACQFKGKNADQYWRKGPLPTSGANKHVFRPSDLKGSVDLLFAAMPADEDGVVYAVNPLFELSGAELRAMLDDETVNWFDVMAGWAGTTIDRALTPGAIPTAHADYQNDSVRKFFIDGSTDTNHHGNSHLCTGCMQSFWAYRVKWQNGRVALCYQDYFQGEAEIVETCPASKQKSRVSEIAVPSGKLIFTDTFRIDGYNELTQFSSFKLDTEYGRVEANQFGAQNGVFHGAVPPATWHICGALDNKVMVLADPWPKVERLPGQSDEEYDEAYDAAIWAFDTIEHIKANPVFSHLGEIDTVCWSYAMMDEDFMSKQFPEEKSSIPSHPVAYNQCEYGKLHCPPGTYRQIYIDNENVFEWQNLPEIQLLPKEVRDTFESIADWPVIAVLVHTSLL